MADLYGYLDLSLVQEPWKGFKPGDKAYWVKLCIDPEGAQYDEMRCCIIEKLVYNPNVSQQKQHDVEVIDLPYGDKHKCTVIWLFHTKEEAIEARVKCYREHLESLECIEEFANDKPNP